MKNMMQVETQTKLLLFPIRITAAKTILSWTKT